MIDLLKKYIDDIHHFESNRLFWLRLSGYVAIVIILIILDWFIIGANNILWILTGMGLVLSLAWWYWTMKLVRHLLAQKIIEVEILMEIVQDLKEVKETIDKDR